MLSGKAVPDRLHLSYRFADKKCMNGIFIVIEISDLQQYLIVDAPAANEMIKNCERSINSTIRSSLFIHGSFLIFSVQAELENADAIIEAAENLLEIIGAYSEDIHEFSMMLLQRKNTGADVLEAELKQSYFSIAVDSSLLIENQIVSAARRSMHGDAVPGYQQIKLNDHLPASEYNENLKRLIDPNEVNRLMKLIVPELGIGSDCSNFVLSGGSELVIRLNLDEAVKIASGKNKSVAAVYIDCLEHETDVIMPFVRSIDRQLIPIVEEYLQGVELKTWIAGKNKLESFNSDYPEEYFFCIYCLYLKGVLKSFKQALQPPVIVFSGVRKVSDPFIRYAERILEYVESDCSPISFFINSGEDGNAFDYQMYDYFNDIRDVSCCADINAPDRAKKLNYLHSRLLYAILLTEGLFERHILDEFLVKLGFSKAEISMGINTLESGGCIIKNRFLRVIRSNKLKKVIAKISEKEEVFRVLGSFIGENIHTNVLIDYGRTAVQLAGFASEPVVGDAVFNCLTKMLDLGHSSFVLNYLSDDQNLAATLSDALELRCFLIENKKIACLEILKGIPEKPESPHDVKSSLLLLEASRYFHAMSDYQRALDYVKKVLIFLQEGEHDRLEGIAFIELGFLMLCKGRLLESSEYLNLAVEKLLGSGDSFSLMKAYLFTAVQQYLWGALDSSMDSTEKALELSCLTGFEEWQFYIEFFKCRLLFELGRYFDAEKMLSECLLRSEIYRDDSRKKIFSAWTARACVYQGKIYRGINMLLSLEEDPEVLFFLSEAYYFNGNMEKAVDSIEKAGIEDSYFTLGFMPLEHISWKNGFASIEGRILRSNKGTGVLLHNIRAMQAFLLGMTGNREYGTEILFSLTRDEKISENDPYNRFYFYLYCQLLESRKNTEMIDKLTLISKALKYLQQTSSRINNPKIRQQFMTKNYWNSRLVAEAQREKLI